MSSSVETLWTCDEQDGVTATVPGPPGVMPNGWAHISYTPSNGIRQDWDLCPNSLQQTIATVAATIAALPPKAP